jgi:aminoglycoside phosphotransferase (APT) family kinase protein
MINDVTLPRLEAHLRDVLAPGGSCRVVSYSRIAMGQSRANFRVQVELKQGDAAPTNLRLVVRIEQWGLLGTTSNDEVKTMRALHACGYPVARVLDHDLSTDILGQPFFVMEEIPGTSVHEPSTVDRYIGVLKQLHDIDWTGSGFAHLPRPADPRDAARIQVERWYRVYRDSLVGEPSPLLEEGAEWLRRNAPETARVTLVHGDPGPGNYMHQNGEITAVVDWEFTHLGDADEDWAYLIAMRGAGVMAEDEWVEHLRKVHGVVLDPERLRYWKAFNYYKGACLDQTALKLYVDGKIAAPNALAIATGVHLSALRRLAETVLL